MMSGGVMSFTVIGVDKHELLDRLIQSLPKGIAVFEAKSNDDPSENPGRRRFEVRVQTLHLDAKPHAVDVLDQDDNWFQIVLHDDIEPIEFEITTH